MEGISGRSPTPRAKDEITGNNVTTLDIAEILAEMRAMRNEIGEIKIAIAEQRGQELNRRVVELDERVGKLELWRAVLAGVSTASGLSAAGALAKLFGG